MHFQLIRDEAKGILESTQYRSKFSNVKNYIAVVGRGACDDLIEKAGILR